MSPHTDNPYRNPVPTLQLLLCLRDAAAGGETGLLDGFTPWPFGYSDDDTELRACQPLIGLSPRGRIREVRFNHRSMLALRLPAAEAGAAYAAYRAWAELLARPEFLLRLRLAPGDCLILDNTRVLHARSAFSAAGERHLQGCYADLDSLLGTLAVLRRRGR
ncbi:TauD/TfdA family dioxygenase [Trebonia sp.]|uniref:TauD/TfdA family dioxygenase n=1 Tax=Trebonia sp. TaxID=2767075 RepID=UPI002626DE6E|nr:TauD/TfdA family dioxygenase [Trebonia sp.]